MGWVCSQSGDMKALIKNDYLKTLHCDSMRTYLKEMILEADRRVELAKDRTQQQTLVLAFVKLLVLLPELYLSERRLRLQLRAAAGCQRCVLTCPDLVRTICACSFCHQHTSLDFTAYQNISPSSRCQHFKKPNILPQIQMHPAAYNFVTGDVENYVSLYSIGTHLVKKFGARLKFTCTMLAHSTRCDAFPARVYWLIVGARVPSGGSVVEGTLGVAHAPLSAHTDFICGPPP